MGVYSTDILLSACMQRLHSFCFHGCTPKGIGQHCSVLEQSCYSSESLKNYTTFLLCMVRFITYNNSYYNFSIIIHSTSGYEECQSTFNDQDLQFCQQYSSVKPAPSGIEFLELVYTYYCMKMAGTCQTIVRNH